MLEWALVAVTLGNLPTANDRDRVTLLQAGFSTVRQCEDYARAQGMPVGVITPFAVTVTLCFGSTLPPVVIPDPKTSP